MKHNEKNIFNHIVMLQGARGLDKSSKSSLSTAKTPLKTPPFPAASENGIKMGLFDPSQLQYPPQLFWPHATGFSGLPLGKCLIKKKHLISWIILNEQKKK